VLSYRPNNIVAPGSLEAGRYILLPGATRKPPVAPPPVQPKPKERPASTQGGSGLGGGSAPPPSGGGRFSYPLGWWLQVSDPFGAPRGGGAVHPGIDLDLYGANGAPVYSSCNGAVTRTEWLTYSYGYHVIVDCGDGWSTLYAHMDQINVSPGQRVAKGTILGISGITGFTTGEHLHFEIRFQGAPVNPADYLGF
jgi:murein DD-endopeptidase MepM/ murein hydrolase activator NlpD